MSTKLIFNCTWGREDAERLCTVEAARLVVNGGTNGIEANGLPKLCDLLREFVANHGSVWLCGACTKPRTDHAGPSSRRA